MRSTWNETHERLRKATQNLGIYSSGALAAIYTRNLQNTNLVLLPHNLLSLWFHWVTYNHSVAYQTYPTNLSIFTNSSSYGRWLKYWTFVVEIWVIVSTICFIILLLEYGDHRTYKICFNTFKPRTINLLTHFVFNLFFFPVLINCIQLLITAPWSKKPQRWWCFFSHTQKVLNC
jgi:hypothetical protein